MLKTLGLSLVGVTLCLSAAALAQHQAKAPVAPYAQGDGPTTYTKHGNSTYGSDGSTAEKYGDTTYGSNGETYETYGNTTYGSDGSKAERIGGTTFIEKPDGKTAKCETIGDETFCDK